MAVVAPERLVTADEFFDFCHRPENRDRHFELERGEIEEMSLPGQRHGVVCTNSNGIMWNYTRRRKRGFVCGNDTGLILERDPDTVRGADVAVYAESKKYAELSTKYVEQLPDVAIEVMSPNDRVTKLTRRITLFLRKGVKLVWLLDPESQSLTIYRLGREPIILESHEEVTGEDVLPDFRCRVADFFEMPTE